MDYKDKKVAVLGLGIEGKDAVRFFLSEGATVTVFDRKEESEIDLEGIDVTKVEVVSGSDYLKEGLSNFDLIVRSPGVYRYIPEITAVEESGVLVTSTIKIFFEKIKGKVIGVTGTKGKGTTSTLIHRILEKNGNKVFLAGNIGTPVLELLPKLTDDSWVVLELSSFQLMDFTARPNIAVILNITLDHLDWHKDKNEYIEAKRNLVKNQIASDYAVINSDYETPKSFSKDTKAKVYYFSRKGEVDGAYVEDGQIILNTDQKSVVGKTTDLLLRGEHNWENICAAICATSLTGASLNSIQEVVFTFKGLEHRLELLGSFKGISFYDDSISTNPQTTEAAVNAFSEPMTLILGGSDKGLSYNELAEKIARSAHVKNIILIGQISKKIEEALADAKFSGKLINLGMTSMKEVVATAKDITKEGGVVILSPATASFDMFRDYKDRGNQFKQEVLKLG